MSFACSARLNGLTTREAIADAFFRIMAAFDDNDSSLLDSAIAADIIFNFNGTEISGFANVKSRTVDTIGRMDTTHLVTNIRIEVEDDSASTARMTANTLAQHYPEGMGPTASERRLLGGSRHSMVLIKDEKDELWKVNNWVMKSIWHEGDRSVMKAQS